MTNKYEQAFAKYNTALNDEQVHQAVGTLIKENRAKYDTAETLKYLLTTVELTTLTCTDKDYASIREIVYSNFRDYLKEAPIDILHL